MYKVANFQLQEMVRRKGRKAFSIIGYDGKNTKTDSEADIKKKRDKAGTPHPTVRDKWATYKDGIFCQGEAEADHLQAILFAAAMMESEIRLRGEL